MSQGYNVIIDVSKLKGTTGRKDDCVDHNKNSPLDYVFT